MPDGAGVCAGGSGEGCEDHGAGLWRDDAVEAKKKAEPSKNDSLDDVPQHYL